MKQREAIIGVLVAAVLAGGVLFVHLRHQPVSAGNGPEVDLDISAADGHMLIDSFVVEVAVVPRPARPFENLQFQFRFTRDGVPASVGDPRVSFKMTMDMGPHDYKLVRDGDRWLASDVVLPKCGSGSRLWFGDLAFRDPANNEHHGQFEINLAPES